MTAPENRPAPALPDALASADYDRPLARLRAAVKFVLARDRPDDDDDPEVVVEPSPPRARPRVTLRAVTALILITVAVAVVCGAAWGQFAGRPVVLRDVLAQATGGVVDLERDLERDLSTSAPGTGARDLATPDNNIRSVSPTRKGPSPRSGDDPLAVDGTALATGLTVLVTGLGAVAQRRILARLHRLDELDEEEAEEPARPARVRELVDMVGSESPSAVDDARGPSESSDDEHDAAGRAVGTAADTDADEDVTVSVVAVDALGADISQHAHSFPLAPTHDPLGTRPHAVLYDRRGQRRVTVQDRARLQWAGHDVACRTEDVDMLGLRCSIPATAAVMPPVAGTRVVITVTLGGLPVSLNAVTRWARSEIDGFRIGLRFDPLNETQQALLLAFLEDQVEDLLDNGRP